MPKSNRLTKGLKILFLNAFFLSIGLIALEGLARIMLTNPILMNRFHEAVEYGEYTTRSLKPNAVFYHESLDGRWEFRTNSYGFRMDREPLVPKPGSAVRVLMLGDSHTQGMEVHQDETFSERLNGKACDGKKLEVINTGISGSGTSEHLVMLEAMLDRLHPDIVIEAFYPNDLLNNESAFHKVEKGILKVATYKHPALKGLRILKWHNDISILSWLSQNSYLYSVVMNTGWDMGKRIIGANQRKKDNADRLENDDGASSHQFELFNAIVAEMARITKKAGAEFYVINIPNRNGYDFTRLFDKENSMVAHEISYPTDRPLHVAHGARHINASTHKFISDDLYRLLCTTR